MIGKVTGIRAESEVIFSELGKKKEGRQEERKEDSLFLAVVLRYRSQTLQGDRRWVRVGIDPAGSFR